METQDISTIDEKSTDDLLMALQASRDEVPALNIDGVCIFRLTRRAKCTEVGLWCAAIRRYESCRLADTIIFLNVSVAEEGCCHRHCVIPVSHCNYLRIVHVIEQ